MGIAGLETALSGPGSALTGGPEHVVLLGNGPLDSCEPRLANCCSYLLESGIEVVADRFEREVDHVEMAEHWNRPAKDEPVEDAVVFDALL